MDGDHIDLAVADPGREVIQGRLLRLVPAASADDEVDRHFGGLPAEGVPGEFFVLGADDEHEMADLGHLGGNRLTHAGSFRRWSRQRQ